MDKKIECIEWYSLCETPRKNQFILLALLHDNVPAVIMGHYSTKSGFHENTYHGIGCQYIYWAPLPKYPSMDPAKKTLHTDHESR